MKPIILGMDAIYSKILSLESHFQKFQQSSSHLEGQSKISGGVTSKKVVTERVIGNKENVITDCVASNNENLNKNKRKSALFKEINLRSDNDFIETVAGPSKTKRKRRKKSLNNVNPSSDHGNDVVTINVPGRKSIVGCETTTVIKVVKPAESVKYIHVTRIDSSTSDQSLVDYLAAKLNINGERLKCFRLSRNPNPRLEIVSFKIGVPSDLFDDVFKSKIWPNGVMVREFVRRPRNKVARTSKNSNDPPSRSNM